MIFGFDTARSFAVSAQYFEMPANLFQKNYICVGRHKRISASSETDSTRAYLKEFLSSAALKDLYAVVLVYAAHSFGLKGHLPYSDPGSTPPLIPQLFTNACRPPRSAARPCSLAGCRE
jgi:hypothetical protein